MCFRARAPVKAIAFVERRSDVGRDEFLAAYEGRDLPRLLDEAGAVRCVQNRVEPEAAAVGDVAVECVTEIWFDDPEERRVAYVAASRARRRLLFTRAPEGQA